MNYSKVNIDNRHKVLGIIFILTPNNARAIHEMIQLTTILNQSLQRNGICDIQLFYADVIMV